ncbi:MAG: HAMP domain-containing sensor histidine kinase [Acidobacteriota bacterium]
MKIKRRPSLMLLLAATLLVLLPLLAVLQYRWLGEVSAGERERMQTNLRTSADRFCTDFDRELTNVYMQLQNVAGRESQHNPGELAVRYQHWLSATPRPKLVREIYRTWIDNGGKLTLAHFDQKSNSFEVVEWPESLKSLRERFEAQQQAQQSTQMILRNVLSEHRDQLLTGDKRGFVLQISLGQIADDIPALVIPDAGPNFPSPLFNSHLEQKHACAIAVLDPDYIKGELIPELARRYFASDGTNDYNLAIVRRGEGGEVVYQTDERLPISAFERSDVKNSLFRIRPEEVDRLFIAGIPTPPKPPQPPKPKDVVKESSSRVAIRVLQSDVNIKKSAEGKHETIQLESSLPRQIIKRSEEGNWQLMVKHRAGSLDAAVANVRRRNLGISFGILLLLSVSVGFIVMSSRRSERLATQQMEFVAGVSHELRTPLAVICSAAENLADGVIDNRDQIKRYGGLIRDEGRRLTGMVEQVLEFAGAQSGKKTYDLRPTELGRVIEHALAACQQQLTEGGFEVEKEIAADLPVVNADADALSRAIQNLLNNAMKYSGDRRWIGLSVESVKTDRNDEVQIKISDRGLGITPSELPHIFDPFYRGKDVVAGQIHGNGLGLSLVRHIVDYHAGRVSVKSKAGQGSEFTVHIPVIPAQEFSASSQQNSYEQTNFAR